MSGLSRRWIKLSASMGIVKVFSCNVVGFLC
jgi:hypothetical protein